MRINSDKERGTSFYVLEDVLDPSDGLKLTSAPIELVKP